MLFPNYHMTMGSHKLHRRINKVKVDLEHSRRWLKDVRDPDYYAQRDEEEVIQRIRFTKEIIDDLRLTLSDEPEPVVVHNKNLSVHF